MKLLGTVLLVVIVLSVQQPAYGQRGRGAAPATFPTGKPGAPFDPTGYWVSLITNNWRFRMVPPAKGDYAGIPISMAGKQLADAWDPARDEASGNQCKHYGAASIMYQPTRLHITWQDDNTLRVDTDAGTQTRVFQFPSTGSGQAARPSAPGKRTWQGSSAAVWEARRANNPEPSARYLKVTTTNMLSGYLRKNGVPYGEGAVLTEYYDLVQERDGTTMMFVTAVVQDPVYLEQRYIVISHFRKEPDGSKWDPTPCSARW
jgi:hypothetical protein